MRKRGAADAAGGLPLDDDPGMVTALVRGLDVLRSFRREDGALGNQEIARRTGLPKATVSRLTYTLSRLGYLVHLPETANYRLGPGALALGFATLGSLGVRDVARPFMQALADETQCSVALATRDGMAMLYVEACRGSSAIRVDLDVGGHLKLATSAIGRAYLAGLAERERADLMAKLAAREGAAWPDMAEKIAAALEDFRAGGFVVSAGDWKREVNAVGVPLAIGTGGLAFALNCGGPAFALPAERLRDDVGPKLVRTAAAIRGALGL
ncbi:IclR family transcriptional regulator [Aurantimonas sp. A2-1-M11]|uniref:IclR family transcriptional regulator n=1 Tax=Aurantimonas sp. A2-1-M11 TaxID=3113712 RepID=UPI002F92B927